LYTWLVLLFLCWVGISLVSELVSCLIEPLAYRLDDFTDSSMKEGRKELFIGNWFLFTFEK
jgi:hypothetical protein